MVELVELPIVISIEVYDSRGSLLGPKEIEIPDPTSTHGVDNRQTMRRQELRCLPGCKRSRPRQRRADSGQEGERQEEEPKLPGAGRRFFFRQFLK